MTLSVGKYITWLHFLAWISKYILFYIMAFFKVLKISKKNYKDKNFIYILNVLFSTEMLAYYNFEIMC